MREITNRKEDLESRLSCINTLDIKESLIFQLENRDYSKAASRNNPYLKYDLIDAIINNINQYAPTEPRFKSNLNSTLNKDEAKRIYYGLVCIEGYDSDLSKVMTKLIDWERVCFFAGVWNKRAMIGIRSKDLPKIIEEYIKAGYNLLHKKHMIKYSIKEYKRPLKIPHSQNYYKKKDNKGKQLSFDF